MSIAAPHTPARPPSIVAAFWLILGSAALTVVSTAVATANVLSPDGEAALRRSIESTPGALDGELDLDSLVAMAQATGIVIQVFFALFSIAIALWIAFGLRAGRRYIRIVATVLGVLQLLATVVAPSPIAIVSLMVVALAVVLSWTNASSRHLAAHSAARRTLRETVAVG